MPPNPYLRLVQELYIVNLGRPADPRSLLAVANALMATGVPPTLQGLLASTNPVVDAITLGFTNSAEARSRNGSNLTSAQSVTIAYKNLLNRTPDAAGLAYWTQEIAAGRLALSDLALAIGAAAESSPLDLQTIKNKLDVATAFTDALDTDAEIAAFAGDAAAEFAERLLSNVDNDTGLAEFGATLIANVQNLAEGDLVVSDATGNPLPEVVIDADPNNPPAPAPDPAPAPGPTPPAPAPTPNVAPVIAAPVNASATEDTPLAISGLSVSDANTGDTLTTTLNTTHGNLTVTGAGVVGSGTHSVTITGTQAQVNAALGTLSYTGDLNYNGTDTLTIGSNDGKLSDSDSVAITVSAVNDAPGIIGIPPAPQPVVVGAAAALADFMVADVDSTNLTVTLTTTNGALNNLTDANAAAPGIQLTGTAAAINSAIAGATFTATASGAASIGISVTDGALTTTGTYNLTASAAPAPTPGITLIHDIQGPGNTSPLVGTSVTVQARVTAWLPNLNLFFVQEEAIDHDANDLTSEGIAVFYGASASPVNAASIGDVVRFTGTVAEFDPDGASGSTNTFTQLTTVSGFTVITDGTAANLDPARIVYLPIATGSTLERYEGELIEVRSAAGGNLFAGDTFTFGRFGEVTYYADAAPFNFSQQNLPSVSGNTAYLDLLARSSINVEDGSNTQNPSLATQQADAYPYQRGGADLSASNYIRVGDNVAGITGVLAVSQFSTSGQNAFELQPTQTINLTPNVRPTAVDSAAINANGVADIRVTAANVLNYFVDFSGSFTTTAGNSIDVRGANNQAEFLRQQAKLVNEFLLTGADVFGLSEVQNNGFSDGIAAIDNLTDALNAAYNSANPTATANPFRYISGPFTTGTGAVNGAGSDAISVGIIYNALKVTPLGSAAAPSTTTYSAYANQNRVPIAQTFGLVSDNDKQFTLVVNHLKSKGSLTTSNSFINTDQLDGQGNNNPTRLQAAAQLAEWLNTNPTGATDGDYLLVGDFNAYGSEDPIRYLTDTSFNKTAVYGGYDIPTAAENLSGTYTEVGSTSEYSYVFGGLRGSLDHVLQRGLGNQITGEFHLNINAAESVNLDYNTEFNDPGLYSPGAFRASDHDPVVVGLRLTSQPGKNPATAAPDVTAPLLVSSNPADNATTAVPSGNIVLTFNEFVRKGSGNITLHPIAGGADVVIDVNSSQVVVNDAIITINPTNDLDFSTGYSVRIAPGAIQDRAGNNFAGFADDTTLNFTTRASLPYFSLASGNFSQDWTNAGLITANNVWTGVPFIIGYRGDALTAGEIGADPQTILGAGTEVINVSANQTNPNTNTGGGVAEFAIANPVVALQGSGTAQAPNLVFFVNATGRQNITVSYNLRDIDGSADNAIQPVALQYRLGESGDFINVPDGFVADASSGPSLATLTTAVTAVLPAAVNGAARLQIRVITTNANGSDEWIGVDDIVISSAPTGAPAPAPAVNVAPAGTDATLTIAEDAVRTFNMEDFGFSDVGNTPANTLASVRISSLPLLGTLSFNGVPITAMQVMAGFEIAPPLLTYTPVANASGDAYASFTFQVRDNGGTANSGVDLDQSPNTITFNVTAVNDAPTLLGVPATTQSVTTGTPAPLADFTVADIDSASLTVTLTTTNGTISNLIDADGATAGIQLTGAPAAINAAIAGATFTATADGAASIGISVSDGVAAAATGTYNFTAAAAADTAAPTLTAANPLDNAVNVAANSNIVLTFSESVVAGSGNIVIAGSGGAPTLTITVTDPQITGLGTNTITINPTANLRLGTAYNVQVDATAFKDTAGNAFAGIADATTLNFDTKAGTAVFINEIHYDNTGNDAGESISIVGPANTDLSKYSVVLFNGGVPTAAVSYVGTGATALPALIDNEGSGFGEVSISFGTNGIQNGTADGLGLLFDGQVIQLLSYEGVFTVAAGQGAFSGLTSTDIGVAEAGTEVAGFSLQLIGTGRFYEDFIWRGPTVVASAGTINTGQIFV